MVWKGKAMRTGATRLPSAYFPSQVSSTWLHSVQASQARDLRSIRWVTRRRLARCPAARPVTEARTPPREVAWLLRETVAVERLLVGPIAPFAYTRTKEAASPLADLEVEGCQVG